MPLNRTAAARCSGATAADVGVLQVEGCQVGGRARGDSRSGQAEAVRAVDRQAAPERRRRARVAVVHEHVAAAALAARAALRLAGLLERIEADVGVGAERDPDAALPELLRRQEAVAEVGLGRRAGAHGGLGLAEQVELAREHVRGMHHGRPVAEQAAVVEVLDRVQAELLDRLLDLARLLGGVDVHRIARPARVRGDHGEPLARHGAQRVRRVADGHERIARDLGRQALDAVEIGLDAAVAEAPLLRRRPPPRSAARVRGQQQHDAHADRARRRDDRERELVRLLVGRPVLAVVDVVELADRRVAGPPARVEALLRHLAHPARVERLGGRVHRLAPRPEVVLRARQESRTSTRPRRCRWKACECPLTRPGTSRRPGRRTTSARSPAPGRVDDRRDPPVCELDRQARAHGAAGLEHEIGNEQRAGHGSMGRSRPRSRAVSRASA